MFIFRHVAANLLMLVAAAATSIYLDPYSLHRVVSATYEQFDLPPDETGYVAYSPGQLVDYRLSQVGLHCESADEIREVARRSERESVSDTQIAARMVELVRSRLSQHDDTLPPADTLGSEQLYRHGTDYYCLCSDYSRLLNEALQTAELLSRIVWMEGHVVVEYFDSSHNKWVFLDPHMNLKANSPDGGPLSIAQLVFAVERELPIDWMPICNEPPALENSAADRLDSVWFRNILLNGECYSLSGETLAASGRWSQLLKYCSCPQIVTLVTPFDTSRSRFESSLRIRSVIILHGVLVGFFYLGRSFIFSSDFSHGRMTDETTIGIAEGLKKAGKLLDATIPNAP